MAVSLAYIYVGDTQPTTSTVPISSVGCSAATTNLWFNTSTSTLMKYNGSAWASAEGATLPSGIIVMWGGLLANIPSGWNLCDGANGTPDLRSKFIKGSAAGINPGVTGGAASATYTPAGSVAAPIFTGSALAAHAHELPYQIPSTTTIRQIAVATFGTGTSRAATAVSAAGTANTTSAAVALSEAKSAGTPAGTNSAPGFTGTQASIATEPVYYSLAFIQKA